MSLEALKKAIQENKIPNVLLLYGEEDFMKNHYARLAEKALFPEDAAAFSAFNKRAFDGKNIPLEEAGDAIEGLAVFGGKKLLLFNNSLIFKTDSRTGAKQEVRAYFEKALKKLPDNCHLVFTESEIDKRSALYKLVSKEYLAVEFPYLDEKTMVDWGVKQFQMRGKRAAAATVRQLLGALEPGMTRVKNEIEKLCAFLGERTELTPADVEAAVTPSVQNRVFDMVGAAMRRDAQTAMRLLRDLFLAEQGNEPKIMGALVYHLEKLICAKLLVMGGKSRGDAVRLLGGSPYAASKYLSDAAKADLNALRAALEQCANADIALKSSGGDKKLVLEMLILEIAA
jgi:DNA polymerase-3 subunit delta